VFPLAREVDVTGFDPGEDLDRRTCRWGHRLPSTALPDVLAFGVALADVEMGAWDTDDPVAATRGFEDRRFLFSDRLVHWVVPLTFVHPGADSDSLRTIMLTLGDRLRPAPAVAGGEGLQLPGEDSYGPVDVPLRVSLGDPDRWRRLTDHHPGTARLWNDLARRASQEGFADRQIECPSD